MTENQLINYENLAESFQLALKSHDEIPNHAIEEVLHTVEEACANNESHLMWKEDYDEFMAILDGLLDGLYDNGYDEQIQQLDDLRAKLESIDQ